MYLEMTESNLHKISKEAFCGCDKKGRKTEYNLPSNRRLDCLNVKQNICVEVEFNKYRIQNAKKRLEEAQRIGKCNGPRMVVRDKDLLYAKEKVTGTNIEVIPVSKINKELEKCSLKKDNLE